MTHRITPPPRFGHAAQLRTAEAGHDPRLAATALDAVEVDLRRVEFINGPAILWAAIYLQLAKRAGWSAELLVPENTGVAQHLVDVGLCQALLDANVSVDMTGLRFRAPGARVILPITVFAAPTEDLINHVADQPGWRSVPVNLVTLAIEVLAELAANVVQHAASSIGGLALVEMDAKGTIHIVVADGGIGVRAALARNQSNERAARYDWTALDHAVRERVSGTGDPTRGIGLFAIATDIQAVPGRQLLLHSGIGALRVGESGELSALRSPLFPGTLAHASIPTLSRS
ncbi:MAG: hypothetical protein EPO26_07780 [Chloroflexota bacterium]|nr:MAG: hypothetical protein EPO26_07780 [Chloroflexota bacterium]